MTAALMVLPLILIVARRDPACASATVRVWSGVLLGLLVFAQFFLSSELLAVTAPRRVVGVVVLVVAALIFDRAALRRLAPHAARAWASASASASCSWPGRSGSRSTGRRTSRGWCGPTSASSAASSPRASSAGYPSRGTTSSSSLGGYKGSPWRRRRISAGGSWRCSPRGRRRSGATAASGSSASCSSCAASVRSGIRRGQWVPARLFDHVPGARERDRAALHGRRVPGRRGDAGRRSSSTSTSCSPTGAARSARWAVRPWRSSDGVIFGERLPFTMRPGDPAPLVHDGGADLPPGACCCRIRRRSRGSRPPWRGRRSTACTTARPVAAGPRECRGAGTATAGFKVLGHPRPSASGCPQPSGTPAQRGGAARARVWEVTTVVIATNPAAPHAPAGHTTPSTPPPS